MKSALSRLPAAVAVVAAIVVALPVAPASACDCAPPPLVRAYHYPAEGEMGVPLGAGVVLHIVSPTGDRPWGIERAAQIVVTLDGEVVRGLTEHDPETGLVIFRADAGFEPGATYEVEYSLNSDGDEPDIVTATFQASPPVALPVDVPVLIRGDVLPEPFELDDQGCPQELRNQCCGCWGIDITAGEWLRVRVRAQTDERPLATAGVVKAILAPNREDLASDGLARTVGAAFAGDPIVEHTAILGRRTDWGSDEICYRLDHIPAYGDPQRGSVTCVDIDDPQLPPVEPRDPADPEDPANPVDPDSGAALDVSGGRRSSSCATHSEASPLIRALTLLRR